MVRTGRTLRRAGVQTLIAACATAMACAAQAHAEDEPVAGNVRFYQLAKSAFDPYTQNPTPAEQAWMREHYFRMQAWSPYFDARLAWFPDTWVYIDSYAIKSDMAIFSDHPEWVLRDQANTMLYIPYACGGGTCPQFAGDVGNPAYRAWWIGEAVETISRGYIGLWVDDVNLSWRVSDGNGNIVIPIDPRTGETMLLADWQRYFAEFMEEIRAALPDTTIGHNAIWYTDSPGFDNPYVNRQIDAADYYNLERGASDDGLTGGTGEYGFTTFLAFIDRIHARGRHVILMDEATTVTQREFALAGWFLVSDGHDMVSSENLAWTAPDNWWGAYDLRLGVAQGARYLWNGVWRRDFECGLVVLNGPGSSTRTLNFAATYTDWTRQPLGAVELAASTARIILKPCAGDPAPLPPDDLQAN